MLIGAGLDAVLKQQGRKVGNMMTRIFFACALLSMGCASTEVADTAEIVTPGHPIEQSYFDLCIEQGHGGSIAECEIWAYEKLNSKGEQGKCKEKPNVANQYFNTIYRQCISLLSKDEWTTANMSTCRIRSFQHVIGRCKDEGGSYCGLE